MDKACLIGEKLAHSYSKIIHEKLGYRYDLTELPREKVREFVKDGAYDCFNVTIPYKKTVMGYLDYLSDAARAIGAVNTVVRKNGKTYGYNTDVLGFGYMFKRDDVDVADKKVLILGSGGTGVMADYYAKSHGAKEVIVISREGDNNYSNIQNHFDAQIIVNATPVGMYPDNGISPIMLQSFNKAEYVVDVIYNPLMTKLLFDAKEMGIKYRNGLLMLVAQAVYAKGLFTDTAATDEEIDRVYDELVSETKNIVLIGMASCGKSTIGKMLAEKTGKLFVDTDAYVSDVCGQSISDIFAEEGEAFFRAKEAQVVETVGKEKGQIIALGGGAVLNERAYRQVKQNGVIVYIKRDKKFADFSGRPLLSDENAYDKLLLERKPIYESYADIVTENNGDASVTVDKILEQI